MRDGMGKFRGLAIDGSGWKYGYLSFHHPSQTAYITLCETGPYASRIECEVDQETIGQYTGLEDKSGKEIFEGDRVKRISGEYIVVWHRDGWALFNGSNHISVEPDIREVIGTIHDKEATK